MKASVDRWRLGLALIIAVAGCGGPRTANTNPGVPSAPKTHVEKEEDFVGGPREDSDLTLLLEGERVVATLTARKQCRNVTKDDRGETVSVEEWKPCGTVPVPSRRLVGKLIAVSVTQATTDANGRATFDLHDVPLKDELFANHRFEVATIPVNVFDLAVNSIDLGATPLFHKWRAARDAKDHATMVEILVEMEQRLPRVKPPGVRLAFESHTANRGIIRPDLLTSEERARLAAVDARLKALQPIYEKEVAAERAEAAKSGLKVGRAIASRMLRAPSTASYASDRLAVQCDSGFMMTVHEVDAQNAFGAMVRSRICPKFNPITKKVIVSRGEENRAQIDIDCAMAGGSQWDCNTLDNWKLTVDY